MASFNSFTLIGNLTANPEMRYTPAGAPICTFSIAVNSRRKDSDGKTVDHVDFFRISTKFKLADVCNKYLKKGRSILAHGELESWRSEGKFGINFIATNIQFLNSAKDAAQGDGGDNDGWTKENREWAAALDGDMPN